MDKQTYLRQLKDRDVAKRKAAVKAAARAIDRDALKQLAVMCEDDPDAEVRELALRAGGFIRKQHGESPTNGKSHGRVAVSEENTKRAQELINSAMTFQNNRQNGKAMKALSQALQLDPNMRDDGYFVNVAEIVTGRLGEGASVLSLLDDKKEQKNVAKREEYEKQQKEVEKHLEEVSKVEWNQALFDAALFFAAMAFGTLFLLFMLLQGSQRYINKGNELQIAINEGRTFTSAEGKLMVRTGNTDPNTGSGEEIVEAMVIDPVFWRQTIELSRTSFLTLIPISAGIGVGATLLMFVFSALTHMMANTVLRGKGKLPHLTHQILAMLSSRMVVLFLLVGFGVLIGFELGGGLPLTIAAGLGAAMLAFFILSIIPLTGKSYHISSVQGLVAILPGGALIGIGVFGVVSMLGIL